MRVKYYSSQDLSCGYNLEKAEDILKNYDETLEYQNINDIIELYNIKKYIDNELYLKTWTTEEKEKYNMIVQSFPRKIAIFIQKIHDQTFVEMYNELDFDYQKDFWMLVGKYGTYKKITKEIFKNFLKDEKPLLYSLLSCKKVVEYFEEEIRSYLISCPDTTGILLSKYELDEKHEIYLPKSLDNKDKEKILHDYIDSEEPNLNSLRLISSLQSNSDRITISPKNLLKARKRLELEESKVFERSVEIYRETRVGFSSFQIEEVITDISDNKVTFNYSTNGMATKI